MNHRTPGPTRASVAMAALAAGLAGCGGGSGSGASAPSGGAVHAAAGHFSLGLIGADRADIARMTQIRRAQSAAALPSVVDLSPKMPAVGNQGGEGSCVAWATAYAMRGYEARRDVWSSIAPKSTDPTLNFSPAFVYNEVNGERDGGTTIPTALSFLQQKGAATLADMPYVDGSYTTQPSAAAIADATHYKLTSYGYIAPSDLTSIKGQLATGLPVILAMSVYYNFFQLGPNEIYTSTSGAYQGGHAVTMVGYDDSKQAVEIINSWSTYWGTAGYGWISYTALSQIGLEAYSAIDDHGVPTPSPTPSPSATPTPTATPTAKSSPTPTPTVAPTVKPSPTPTPTVAPTVKPSPTPTPTAAPTAKARPTPTPTAAPTIKPSPAPTK